MSDWENTFGAGYSAENFIDGLNSSYFGEMRAAEREERERRKTDTLAFHGNPGIKAELLTRMQRLQSKDLLTSEQSGLKNLLQDPDQGFAEFEREYRIPVALAHVIQTVFEGLRKEGYLCTPTPQLDAEAARWLMGCIEAIEPGTDLRYIAPQIAAAASQSGFGLLKKHRSDQHKERREACERALAVIYARARGVILQDRLTKEALGPLQDILKTAYTEFTYVEEEDFAVAIIAAAADPSTEGAARALEYAGAVRLRVGGDAMDIETWRMYSEELVGLIKSAPTKRLKMIDLNRVFP